MASFVSLLKYFNVGDDTRTVEKFKIVTFNVMVEKVVTSALALGYRSRCLRNKDIFQFSVIYVTRVYSNLEMTDMH